MKKWKKIKLLMHSESGSVIAMTAVFISVFMAVTALAVDIGHLIVVKSELQRLADAASLAGVRGLLPNDLANTNPNSNYINTSQGLQRAQDMLTKNAVAGRYLETGEVLITLGIYDWNNKTFTPSVSQDTNAVLVEINNYNVNHFLGGFTGLGQSAASVKSLAAIGYAKGLPPGTMPIAIGRDFLSQLNGSNPIQFAPGNQNNAGWFAIGKVSNAVLVNYVVNDSCPEINLNDKVELLNGKASAADELAVKFEANKSADGYWDISLPIVDTNEFNQDSPITGFVKFRITSIDTQKKEVWGRVLGLGMANVGAKPGGPKGMLLTTPKLVPYTYN